jgi:alcohol dehydrogenase (cytochrome c)
MVRTTLVALSLAVACLSEVTAQVTFERLLAADQEPQNWLTYSGTNSAERHSRLEQVTPENVSELELEWVFQAQSLQVFETTPLVVDGIMYLTEAPNTVVALDARTGRVFWIYEHVPSLESRPCCGRVNRGLAILGETLFMATIDAQLIAIDSVTGRPIWKTLVADPAIGYAMTLAPLVVKDKIVVGVAGGEYGIRGFIAAYYAETGDEAWRFHTIPGPGEPGHDTWPSDSDAWEHGGSATWLTGSYDSDLNLIYWGTGNPGPDFNPAQRLGDNLYSDSVVALDADSGELKWHFQFTPNDPYDYDSVQIPVLVDYPANDGSTLKLMLWANRNGFFYVLNRETGRFINGQPFVDVNWADGLDDNGRPVQTPQPPGAVTYPGVSGGTNWYSPSYSPSTRLFYVPTWEGYGTVFTPAESVYQPGQNFGGGTVDLGEMPPLGRGPVNNWTEAAGRGAVIAIDPSNGEERWRFEMTDVTTSGILTTSSNLLFTGGREGHFQALDAGSGALLWKRSLGGQIANGPITYAVDGRQYVAVAAGNGLFVFALER